MSEVVKKKKKGRPSPTGIAPPPPESEEWEQVFDMIASGVNLKVVAESMGYKRTSLTSRIFRSAKLKSRYLEARELQTFEIEDRIEEVIAKMAIFEKFSDGSTVGMDPRAGKAIINALQWKMKNQNPAMFADTQKIDVKVTNVESVYLDEMQAVLSPRVVNPKRLEG